MPRTFVDAWDSSATSFDSPKSDTLARICLSSRMLLVLMSRWMIDGVHPLCRYSIPVYKFSSYRFRNVLLPEYMLMSEFTSTDPLLSPLQSQDAGSS